MATARKMKNGKYSVLVYDYQDDDGKQHYKRFTAPTKKEAEALASQYKTKKIHASDLQSVGSALDEYIKLRTPVLSPSTIKGYKSIQKTLKKNYPYFMAKNINTVKEKDLQGIVSDVSLTRSPKTTKNISTLLCSISDSFRGFNIALPQTIQYEPYIPTEAEIKAIMDDVKGKELEIPIMLGAYAMMRRGEICSLSMDDINFKNKTIHIKHSMVIDDDNNWVVKPPKTKKSDRTIKVADFVIDAIKQKGYVTNLNPNELTERFKRVVNRLGMPDLRFHDLRHFACSIFAYKNISQLYVQKYGGWSNASTPARIYQHCLRDKEDQIYGTMNDYFTTNFHKPNSKPNSIPL